MLLTNHPQAYLDLKNLSWISNSLISLFLRSVSCSLAMSIEQKLCKVKILKLQSMSSLITCIDKRFEVTNSGISCLALILNSSNPRTTILHARNRFKVARYDKSSTVFVGRSIWTHRWVVKISSSEWLWLGQYGFDSEGCWSCSPLAISAWYWAHPCTNTCSLNCCTSYNLFSLGFHQCGHFALRRFLTLNMNILLSICYWK